VHAVHGGEDVVEVGEDVVGGECDELASTPEHLAEEKIIYPNNIEKSSHY
jgi:hypothetical protein